MGAFASTSHSLFQRYGKTLMRKLIKGIGLFSTILPVLSFAESFPRGCEATGYYYQEKRIILNDDGKQKLYFFHNISKDMIEIERHETRDVFMSPTLKVKLQPGRWAAFASDIKQINFKCFINKDEQRIPFECSDVIDVCQYPRVKFALSNMGNYWADGDKSLRQIMQTCNKKGILLRW